MFNTITIKTHDQLNPLDIWFLAECLLFYKTVNLILHPHEIIFLNEKIGFEVIEELIIKWQLNIYISKSILSIVNIDKGFNYGIVLPSLSLEELLERWFFDNSQRRGYSRRTKNKIIWLIKELDYRPIVADHARSDLENNKLIKLLISETIRFYIPNLSLSSDSFIFEVVRNGNSNLINTDLDFWHIQNESRKYRSDFNLDINQLLLRVFDACWDIYISSELESEIATNSINSLYLKHKCESIYNQRFHNQWWISNFLDTTLEEWNIIREVINHGDKNFNDFMIVLRNAEKFKKWLLENSANSKILQEYYKDVTKESWIEKTPWKIFKWSAFNGIWTSVDLMGAGWLWTVISIWISVFDEFLLSKIIKWWKPSIFIESDLRKFVSR